MRLRAQSSCARGGWRNIEWFLAAAAQIWPPLCKHDQWWCPATDHEPQHKTAYGSMAGSWPPKAAPSLATLLYLLEIVAYTEMSMLEQAIENSVCNEAGVLRSPAAPCPLKADRWRLASHPGTAHASVTLCGHLYRPQFSHISRNAQRAGLRESTHASCA